MLMRYYEMMKVLVHSVYSLFNAVKKKFLFFILIDFFI